MKNIISLDYANKTELVFTFLISTLKDVWPNQDFGDEWDLIEDICERTSARVTRPLFSNGFIIKQKLSVADSQGSIERLTLSIQIVSGLPQLDLDLIKQSLQQDRIIDGLLSITYQDQHNNTISV
jgi:hypothetical protein